MRDLAWIKTPKIHIHHFSMPMSEAPGDQQIYLEILNDAIVASLEHRSPVLTVSFNPELRQNIEALLGEHVNDPS
ncbi:hypothetical protein EI77_02301 [Prosthecobacter fusiformis]|uniref:Uncharacterized protein n=2 Tax=Prosthecobacter fusiformis TaxID=48464 RepID=A0A4R7S0J7_9BACT|nr:hypothetical protein EI77_02301 [Prosthecobacter fusiformis]